MPLSNYKPGGGGRVRAGGGRSPSYGLPKKLKRRGASDPAKRSALRSMASDYSAGRLGSRVPSDRRPSLSITFGEPPESPEEEDEDEREG